MARNGWHGVTAKVQEITPAEAKRILEEDMAKNRNIYSTRVERYADDMKHGRWLFTGEPIIFDTEGKLLNGQHRMQAIVAADMPQRFLTVTGIDKDAFAAMDIGRARTAADVLTIGGAIKSQSFVDARVIATAAIYAMTYMEGAPRRSSHHALLKTPGANRSSRGEEVISHQVVLDFVRKHPAIMSSFELVYENGIKPNTLKTLLPASAIVWTHFETRKLDAVAAERFAIQLMTGTDLRAGDPIMTLRTMLVEDTRARWHIRMPEKLAAVVKTWNAKRARKRNLKMNELRKRDWDKFPRFV